MIGNKLHFVEIRLCDGSIQPGPAGVREFHPDKPMHEWVNFRVVSPDKNGAIDEIIARLQWIKSAGS